MKKLRSLAVLLAAVLISAALAGCSSSGGIKKGGEFTLGGYEMRYVSARVENGGTTVRLLLKDKAGLPVSMKDGGMSILISMKLCSEDGELGMARFTAEPGEQGTRMDCMFPSDDGRYTTAVVFMTGDESRSAVLDLRSGIRAGAAPAVAAVVLIALAAGLYAWRKASGKKK